jgi:hypothetical protein
MLIYEYIALLVAGYLGYRVYQAIGNYLVSKIFSMYFSLSARRFDAIYSVTEESYDYLKDIFKIKAEHYRYVEAMRAFEDIARDKINSYIKDDINFFGKYFLQITLYIGLPGLLFVTVWQFYIIGLLCGFFGPVFYQLAKHKHNGDYATLVSIGIAEQAYRYKYNRKLTRAYKDKLKTNKVTDEANLLS